MTTATDIVNAALVRIGAKTPDNPVDAAVFQIADRELTFLHGLLVSKEVVRWALDAIPDDAIEPMISELAYALRDDFTIPMDRIQSIQAGAIVARGNLYALVEVKYNVQTVQSQYF